VLFSLSGNCTAARAEEIRASLLEALHSGDDIEIDFSGVTGIDLTLCQILHSLRLSCDAKGVQLTLQDNLPKELSRQAVHCGLPEIAGHPALGGAQDTEGMR